MPGIFSFLYTVLFSLLLHLPGFGGCFCLKSRSDVSYV